MDEQIFNELVQSLREARDIARGKSEASRTFTVERQEDHDKPAEDLPK